MDFLYLDDSGKLHPKDPAHIVTFAGFSIEEDRWHDLSRKVTGAKSNFFANRGSPPGNPHSWEIKSTDFLTPNNWKRAKKRRFCFELAAILEDCNCKVFAVSMEKANAKPPLNTSTYLPLAFQRIGAKFYHEITARETTGTIVCDWSQYQDDEHIANCVNSMIASKKMFELRGSVTYGSSHALVHLQIADIIAGTFRRSLEGQVHLNDLKNAFERLRYRPAGRTDVDGYPVDSILKLF